MATAAAGPMAAETVAAQRQGDGDGASEHPPVSNSGCMDTSQPHAESVPGELGLMAGACAGGREEMVDGTEEAKMPFFPCSETIADVTAEVFPPMDGSDAVDAPAAKADTSSPFQGTQGQTTGPDQLWMSEESANGPVALAAETALAAEKEVGMGSLKPQVEPATAEKAHQESVEETGPKKSPENLLAPTTADQGEGLQAKSELFSPVAPAHQKQSLNDALLRLSKHHRLEVKVHLKIGAGDDRFMYESMVFKIHSAFSGCLRTSTLGGLTFTCNMPKLDEDVSHEGKLGHAAFSNATLAWLKRNVSRELRAWRGGTGEEAALAAPTEDGEFDVHAILFESDVALRSQIVYSLHTSCAWPDPEQLARLTCLALSEAASRRGLNDSQEHALNCESLRSEAAEAVAAAELLVRKARMRRREAENKLSAESEAKAQMRRAAVLLTPAPATMTLLSVWRVKLRAAVAAATATDAKAVFPFSQPLLESRCKLHHAMAAVGPLETAASRAAAMAEAMKLKAAAVSNTTVGLLKAQILAEKAALSAVEAETRAQAARVAVEEAKTAIIEALETAPVACETKSYELEVLQASGVLDKAGGDARLGAAMRLREWMHRRDLADLKELRAALAACEGNQFDAFSNAMEEVPAIQNGSSTFLTCLFSVSMLPALSFEALHAASAHLKELHKGRAWAAPAANAERISSMHRKLAVVTARWSDRGTHLSALEQWVAARQEERSSCGIAESCCGDPLAAEAAPFCAKMRRVVKPLLLLHSTLTKQRQEVEVERAAAKDAAACVAKLKQALADAVTAERQARSLARTATRKLDEASKTAHAAKALVEIETLKEDLLAEVDVDQACDPAPDQAFDQALDQQGCPPLEKFLSNEASAGPLHDPHTSEAFKLTAHVPAAAPSNMSRQASTELAKAAALSESTSDSTYFGTCNDITSKEKLEVSGVHMTNPASVKDARISQMSKSLPAAPVLSVSSVFRPQKGAHAHKLAESALVLAWRNGDCGLLPARCVETCVGDSDHARRQMSSEVELEIEESRFALAEDARCVTVCAGEVVRVFDMATVLVPPHSFAETRAQTAAAPLGADGAEPCNEVFSTPDTERVKPASLGDASTIDAADTAKVDHLGENRAAHSTLSEIDRFLCKTDDLEAAVFREKISDGEPVAAPLCAIAAATEDAAAADHHARDEGLAAAADNGGIGVDACTTAADADVGTPVAGALQNVDVDAAAAAGGAEDINQVALAASATNDAAESAEAGDTEESLRPLAVAAGAGHADESDGHADADADASAGTNAGANAEAAADASADAGAAADGAADGDEAQAQPSLDVGSSLDASKQTQQHEMLLQKPTSEFPASVAQYVDFGSTEWCRIERSVLRGGASGLVPTSHLQVARMAKVVSRAAPPQGKHLEVKVERGDCVLVFHVPGPIENGGSKKAH